MAESEYGRILDELGPRRPESRERRASTPASRGPARATGLAGLLRLARNYCRQQPRANRGSREAGAGATGGAGANRGAGGNLRHR